MIDWSPIVEPSSPLFRDAWHAIMDITNAIYYETYSPASLERPHWRYEEPLLYCYLGLVQHDQTWLDRGLLGLNAAIAEAGTLQRAAALFGGICGLGWTITHICQLLDHLPDSSEISEAPSLECTPEDPNAELEVFLIRQLQRDKWPGAYDLIGGLVGLGAFFLERFPAGQSVQGISLVLNHLESSSQVEGSGVSWYSGPALLPQWQRELCPDGYYNLGVAHGIPGILQFLAEVSALGIDNRAVDLLTAGMEWLIKQKRPDGSVSWFSPWTGTAEVRDSRLSWCYGDLGILAILLQVIRWFPREHWKDFTERLLEHCLARPLERAGVNDAPLCHGAAGVAHIFNRIYQAQGDERCRRAALMWFERALAMRITGRGIGGFFTASRPDPYGPLLWEVNPGLLDGTMGIALALLSAVSAIEPEWDRMLLLSSRVPRAHSDASAYCAQGRMRPCH